MGRTKKNVVKAGVSTKLKKGPATISKEAQVAAIAYGHNTISCETEKDYLTFLEKKEDSTSRAIVNAEDMKVFVPTAKQITNLNKQGYPMELIDDTIANTGLFIKIGKEMYPINDSAMSGIKRMVFQRWDSADAKAKAAFINATLCNCETQKQVQDAYIPAICNGTMYSLMTGVYSPIISKDYFAKALATIKNVVGDYQVVAANCSISSYYVAVRFIGERAKEMEELYKERIVELAERRGITLSDKVLEELSLTFGVTIVNNDNGEDAATVTPAFNLGKNIGFRCPDDKAVKYTAYHKGSLNFDNFEQKVENMFALFENFVTKLSAKILTDIANWRVVMAEACKELAIPDAVTNRLIVDFAKEYGNQTVTAYDICMAILNSIDIYKAEQDPSENALENYEARIAGIVNLNLEKYDFDPNALENELKSQYINNPMNVLDAALIELGVPKTVANTVLVGFETKLNMEKLLGNTEELVTSWDIYSAILGATQIYREFLANRKMKGDKEKRIAAFDKNLQKARDICYVKYDVA